jgi:hypothetical protein
MWQIHCDQGASVGWCRMQHEHIHLNIHAAAGCEHAWMLACAYLCRWDHTFCSVGHVGTVLPAWVDYTKASSADAVVRPHIGVDACEKHWRPGGRRAALPPSAALGRGWHWRRRRTGIVVSGCRDLVLFCG